MWTWGKGVLSISTFSPELQNRRERIAAAGRICIFAVENNDIARHMLHARFLYDIGCHIGRYRRTQGYGIHSPRLFYLLREVILQRGVYYAYAPLAGEYRSAARHGRGLCLERKECELLFRLANDLGSKAAVLVGCPTGIEKSYLEAARPRIRIGGSASPVADAGTSSPDSRPGSCLYVVNGRNAGVPLDVAVGRALERMGEGDALYVALPHGRKGVGEAEKAWIAHPHTGVLFDLYGGFLLLGGPARFRQRVVRINF